MRREHLCFGSRTEMSFQMPSARISSIGRAISGFFAELKRRRVLKIAGAYIAGAWLAAEIISFLLEQVMAPAWSFRLLAAVYVVGFPVTVMLAWVIQIQPDGSWAIDRTGGHRRTIVIAVVLGLFATAGLSWLIIPKPEGPPPYQPIPDSIAILPLADSASTPNEQTVAETLYIALLEGLSQSRELTQVRLRLDERPEDLFEFGKSVAVAALLVGSIQNVEGGLRVEMDLLDMVSDEVRWSQSFDWDSTQIIEIGNAIANGVMESMALPPISKHRFSGTDSPEAYEALLMGFEHQRSLTADDLAKAIDDFQQAIDLDAGYALAYVGLAQALDTYMNMAGLPEAERQALQERARRAVDIALKLDKESGAAISMLGLMTEQRELRIQAYERALELDPDDALSYFRYGMEMRADGNFEEAERLVRKAIDLQPMSAGFRSELASILWDQGHKDEALAEIQKAIELDPEMEQNRRKLDTWK
jgi:tetratricopeptide (TPR) repeat protein